MPTTGTSRRPLRPWIATLPWCPIEPNPHDSYGEILRMDGKFDAALEQYRISVRMDPNFGSELGIADTLALMGKGQAGARGVREGDRVRRQPGRQGAIRIAIRPDLDSRGQSQAGRKSAGGSGQTCARRWTGATGS